MARSNEFGSRIKDGIVGASFKTNVEIDTWGPACKWLPQVGPATSKLMIAQCTGYPDGVRWSWRSCNEGGAVGLGEAAALNIAKAQTTQALHRGVGLNMRYLIIDGMLSGTGVRDAVDGGYLELHELGISSDMAKEISAWQARYEKASFANAIEVALLDAQGLSICRRLVDELPNAKINYFSDAEMRRILL